MRLMFQNQNAVDCGIVAVYNVCQWYGRKTRYNKILKVARSCGYSDTKGLYGFQFELLLHKLQLPSKKAVYENLADMERALLYGKCLTIIYEPVGSNNGHALVAIMDHRGKVALINQREDSENWNDFVADISNFGFSRFTCYEFERPIESFKGLTKNVEPRPVKNRK